MAKIKSELRKIFVPSAIIFAMVILSYGKVLAQNHNCPSGQVDTDIGCITSVENYINQVLVWAYPVIGSLAILMIIYSGYVYMTSQGNPERINHAKDVIIGVIVGIVLLFTIRILLTTVGTIR